MSDDGRAGDRGGQPTPTSANHSDTDVTLDAVDDRWAWRAQLRRNPVTHAIWRTAVGVVGTLVTVAGLVMVPAPGPGWLVVFFGLLVLASEFEFAQRWLDFAKHHVSRWNDWVMTQAVWVRGLVVLGTLAVVWAVVWGYLAVAGVPQFMPEGAEQLLTQVPGVD